MALVSNPIAVADATAVSFKLPRPMSTVSVAVVFYSTSDALEGDENQRSQVTRGDVESNGTDLVGWAVDDLDDLTVPSNTDDDTTAQDLADAWNESEAHAAVATASVDLSGAESWAVLTFLDDQEHTVAAVSPATADITSITNTTTAVASTVGTRDIDVSRIDHAEGGVGKLTMPITGATVDAQPARKWKAFDLGSPTGMLSIACPAASNPGGATHYRIWVAA
jgi:hypothetical protein